MAYFNHAREKSLLKQTSPRPPIKHNLQSNSSSTMPSQDRFIGNLKEKLLRRAEENNERSTDDATADLESIQVLVTEAAKETENSDVLVACGKCGTKVAKMSMDIHRAHACSGRPPSITDEEDATANKSNRNKEILEGIFERDDDVESDGEIEIIDNQKDYPKPPKASQPSNGTIQPTFKLNGAPRGRQKFGGKNGVIQRQTRSGNNAAASAASSVSSNGSPKALSTTDKSSSSQSTRKRTRHSNEDILDDLIERAEFELQKDPYRGMVLSDTDTNNPWLECCFSMSFREHYSKNRDLILNVDNCTDRKSVV